MGAYNSDPDLIAQLQAMRADIASLSKRQPARVLYAGPSGDITTASATFVDMTGGPAVTVAASGLYMVCMGVQFAPVGSGTNNMLAHYVVNGADSGKGSTFVANTKEGAYVERTFPPAQFAAGDVVTLSVTTANALSTRFFGGTLLLTPY